MAMTGIDQRGENTSRFLTMARSTARKHKIIPLIEKVNWLYYYFMSNSLSKPERRVGLIGALENFIPDLEAMISRMRTKSRIEAANGVLAVAHEELPALISAWRSYNPQKAALVKVHSILSGVLFSTPASELPEVEIAAVRNFYSPLMLKETITIAEVEEVERLAVLLYSQVNSNYTGVTLEELKDALADLEVMAILEEA